MSHYQRPQNFAHARELMQLAPKEAQAALPATRLFDEADA